MTQSNLADTIRELAAPLAAGLGLTIWGLELAFGGRSLVRLYVETGQPAASEDPDDPLAGQGVSIDQCAELSRLLSLSLDVEDVIPGAYVLEVSSPGLDRTFFTEEQLAGALGRVVDITLNSPLPQAPGRRKFRGCITGAPSSFGAAGLFTLQAEDTPKPGERTPVEFAFADLKKARQVHVVPEKALPGKGARARGKKAAEPARADDAEEGAQA